MIDDLTGNQAAQPVRLMGAATDGTETIPAKVSPNQDLGTQDTCDTAALSTILTIVAGTPQVLKVGASALENRKFVEWEALGTGLKWGFSSGSTPFDAFKNQQFGRPYGPNVSVWFSVASGSVQVVIGEAS